MLFVLRIFKIPGIALAMQICCFELLLFPVYVIMLLSAVGQHQPIESLPPSARVLRSGDRPNIRVKSSPAMNDFLLTPDNLCCQEQLLAQLETNVDSFITVCHLTSNCRPTSPMVEKDKSLFSCPNLGTQPSVLRRW